MLPRKLQPESGCKQYRSKAVVKATIGFLSYRVSVTSSATSWDGSSGSRSSGMSKGNGCAAISDGWSVVSRSFGVGDRGSSAEPEESLSGAIGSGCMGPVAGGIGGPVSSFAADSGPGPYRDSAPTGSPPGSGTMSELCGSQFRLARASGVAAPWMGLGWITFGVTASSDTISNTVPQRKQCATPSASSRAFGGMFVTRFAGGAARLHGQSLACIPQGGDARAIWPRCSRHLVHVLSTSP